MGLFDKIKNGIKKTKDNIIGKIDGIVNSFTKIDEELFEELEESLISADVSMETSRKLCGALRDKIKSEGIKNPEDVKSALRGVIEESLEGENGLKLETKPSVALVVGVNGVGKTTTIGKLAKLFIDSGKKVIVSASDTFRAAAVEQLEIWTDRAGCDIVKQPEGTDPAAVVFDSIAAAKARDADVLICDTAGRLHNKANLMRELEKISRIIDRELPGADRENLLVLDASTGRNALNQAMEFKNATHLTGIVLTKLDGTAKGGMILSVKDSLGIPVKFIGVGEGIDDLQPFDAKAFSAALFEGGEEE